MCSNVLTEFDICKIYFISHVTIVSLAFVSQTESITLMLKTFLCPCDSNETPKIAWRCIKCLNSL